MPQHANTFKQENPWEDARKRVFSLFEAWRERLRMQHAQMTYRRSALFRLVDTANMMIAGEIGPIEGSRTIAHLRFDVDDVENDVFNPFIGIDSESDDVIVGNRALWAESFLADVDRRYEVYDRALRPGIAEDCRALLAVFVPKLHECPACGFARSEQPPYDAAGVPSYETCASCGLECGVTTFSITTSRSGGGAGYTTGCRSAIRRARPAGTPRRSCVLRNSPSGAAAGKRYPIRFGVADKHPKEVPVKRALTTALAVFFLAGFGGGASTAASGRQVAVTPHVRSAAGLHSYYYRLGIVAYPRGFHPRCPMQGLVLWVNLGGGHLSPFNFAGGNPIDVYVGPCHARAGDRMHVTLANAYGSMRIIPRPGHFAIDSVDDSHTTITVRDLRTGATGTAEAFVSY